MGSVGDCYDNAVAETFFATLKKELVYRRSWPTCQELRSEVFEYVEGFYNPRRRHSTLGMLSPDEFEAPARRPRAHARAENLNGMLKLFEFPTTTTTTTTTTTRLSTQALKCPGKRGRSTRPSGRRPARAYAWIRPMPKQP
jgi:Integrase core domain